MEGTARATAPPGATEAAAAARETTGRLRRAVGAHPEWRADAAATAATDDAVFLHCLPIRRGVMATDEVPDGPASVVVERAGARLDVPKATPCRAFGAEVGS